MSAPGKQVDVLVVGAGPTGLFLAGQLLRRGHSCTIVEQNCGPSTHSKALALMPRTLQIFERADIAQPFLAQANRVRGIRFLTRAGCAFVAFARVRSPYAFVAIVPQWKTEAFLIRHLRDAGGAVLYGHAFEGYELGHGDIRATISTPHGRTEIAARYLVGCDGVSSAVRQHAAIPFPGRTYAPQALLADVVMETSVPADEARVHVDGGGIVTMFPIDSTIRRLVVIGARDGSETCVSREYLQARMDCARLPGTITSQPLWVSAFSVHRRLARHMRAGNVLLAGDSAHVQSPIGGQGMNLGLEDAWRLAEILSAVLRGEATSTLLDSYELERLRVARAVVRRTDLLLRALAHPSAVLRTTRALLTPYVVRIPPLRDRMVRRLLTA